MSDEIQVEEQTKTAANDARIIGRGSGNRGK